MKLIKKIRYLRLKRKIEKLEILRATACSVLEMPDPPWFVIRDAYADKGRYSEEINQLNRKLNKIRE